MSRTKITIAIDERLLALVDRLVRARVFSNRSQAIQLALEEKLARLQAGSLERECAKLDPEAEQVLADEGLSADTRRWAAY